MNIHIEGNIGSGKSTLLDYLSNNLECNVAQEPVGEWMKLDLLDKFYNDIDRWSFTFQMNCFISRTQQIDQLPEGNNFIERSILSDKIFAQNCYNNANMDKMEFKIYLRWSSWLYKKVCKNVKNIIYLRSTPEVNYSRIKNRNRYGEESIPLIYLKQLHKLHDDWLIDNKDIKLLILDADTLKFDKNLLELIKKYFFEK